MKKSRLIILIIVTVVLSFLLSAKSQSETEFEKVESFMEMMTLLNENHIYTPSLDTLLDWAIEGIMDNLDVHTNYLSRQDLDAFSIQTEGHFGGLGIVINKIGEYTTVVEPIEDTPAERAGMLAGDKIVEVDGENVVGMDIDLLINKLRGRPGTTVDIGVVRFGSGEPIVFKIKRAVIQISSIPFKLKLDNEIGYIKIRQFNGNTTKEFTQALANLQKQKTNGLIIDLRDNPGGLLSEALATVEMFLPDEKLLLTTRGPKEINTRQYYSKGGTFSYKKPIVVLINEGSASASEIFAGVLQDYDKALIVGKSSYGKGSVQQLYSLKNRDGIKITISKYYIPSGRSIHRDINDEVLKQENLTFEQIRERLDEDNKKKKNLLFRTDGGRVVYGGGGVFPDLEIENTKMSETERELLINNTYFDFSIRFVDSHKGEIDETFAFGDELMSEFLNFAKEEKSLEFSALAVDSLQGLIKTNLQAAILKQGFSRDAAQKHLLSLDNQVEQVLALFRKFTTINEFFNYAESLRAKSENQ